MEINPSTVCLWNVIFSYNIYETPSIQKVLLSGEDLKKVFGPQKNCKLFHMWKVYYSQNIYGMSTFHHRYVERILCIESLWETFGPERYSIHRRHEKCIFSYQICGTGSIYEDFLKAFSLVKSCGRYSVNKKVYRRFLKELLSIGNH